MFAAGLLLYHLRIRGVWADAAYFAFLGFVRDVLHASVNVDYNLRRQGKCFLATLFFVRQWRDLMSPRANIERHFAWLQRYFGLKYLRARLLCHHTVRVSDLHRRADCRLYRRPSSAT